MKKMSFIRRMCCCCCMTIKTVSENKKFRNKFKDYLENEKFKISDSIVFRFAV